MEPAVECGGVRAPVGLYRRSVADSTDGGGRLTAGAELEGAEEIKS